MKRMMGMRDVSNHPVFMMLMFVLVIIIFLAIFRSVSPFLTMGLGMNAHIGTLRGSFQLEAFENQVANTPTFVMFYAPWCGHCKRAKPEFENFKKSYKGPIKVIAIDCEEPANKELAKKHNIQGYPTIRYYPTGLSGQFEEYNGERTADGFNEYVSKVQGVLNKMPDNAAPVNFSN
jgi:protein disulfide-isomerase-like protein